MPAQVLTFSSDGALLNRKPIVMIPPPASTPSTAMLGVAFLPALTFDAAGNIYISDSFAGIIWRYSPNEQWFAVRRDTKASISVGHG